ncbi:hypothetical protein [Microvirga lotononidis]|uniref:Uncharacterized protein n=1 Tax=Microvirga lotononidis TaxID=864069 RepID=I4Z245_9HYPH|nr:hypothetical protein [Microvirga lotononidis]EIM30287.1 hypothetical protein MicloDRAFT_00010920 [Microvirga lotononidis]WQO31133.1 hypothetical protein U0023_33040 [Microvirga lotononidis]
MMQTSIQNGVISPAEAVFLFLKLEWIDRKTGTLDATWFARAYENNAPERDFSVYLERLEAGRAAFCETGSTP